MPGFQCTTHYVHFGEYMDPSGLQHNVREKMKTIITLRIHTLVTVPTEIFTSKSAFSQLILIKKIYAAFRYHCDDST